MDISMDMDRDIHEYVGIEKIVVFLQKKDVSWEINKINKNRIEVTQTELEKNQKIDIWNFVQEIQWNSAEFSRIPWNFSFWNSELFRGFHDNFDGSSESTVWK